MIHSYLIDTATIQVPAMDTLNRKTTTAETVAACYIAWGDRVVKVQAGQDRVSKATVYFAPETVLVPGNKIKIANVSYEAVSITRKRSFPGAELLEVAIT